MSKARPFSISKHAVWEAYEKVKRNRGAAGIDGQTMKEFEKDLKKNLYKIWNRMSSGSYFPPPVKSVAIPKKDGGERLLGIPTVSDRIAQTVVKMELEPILDPIFHEDSYGYRPGKSAHQALEKTRERCWRNPWVIDLDIKGFFDNINHDLLMKALKHHTDNKWIILYAERWLKAEVMSKDGKVRSRTLGTPQGGVVSPLLANLSLHYVFDVWMKRNFPEVKFERFADDVVIHCRYLRLANHLKWKLEQRFTECGLELHPKKTKIVFCRNRLRPNGLGYPESFDFLGFTFRQRTAIGKEGNRFDGFLPAISKSSKKKINHQIKAWKVSKSSDLSLKQLSEMYNPAIRGWVNYFKVYYPRELSSLRQQWHTILTKWALRKYLRRFNGHRRTAGQFIYDIERREPRLFAIWEVFNGSV